MNAECNKIRENLNRYLDNDLSGRDATDLASHLEVCVGCHHVYTQLRAVKTAFHQIPEPSSGEMEAARARSFARLARFAQQKDAAKSPVQHNAWSWHRLNMARVWQPVAVSAFAAAIAALILLPQPQVTPPVSTDGAPLPGRAELLAMFDLHDAHGGSLTATDPTLYRSEAAEAHAALLARADETVSGGL